MARQEPRTTGALRLPLRTVGIALGQSFKAAMQTIDDAITALQGGTGIAASEILYDSGNPGDSNSGQTTVQGALDEIYAELNRLNSRTDSNSQG